MKTKVTTITSNKSWVDGEAISQLENTAKLEGITKAVGMPDLHPGRGTPIGAVFVSQDKFYPHLIGNDIACGISFLILDLKVRKNKKEKLVKKLVDLEGPWDGDIAAHRKSFSVKEENFDQQLGTIGSGNHFAELLEVDKIISKSLWEKSKLNKDMIYLMVHSGSRAYGQKILDNFLTDNKEFGIAAESELAQNYLSSYEDATRWAKANRALVAERISEKLNCSTRTLLDIEHNTLSSQEFKGEEFWLHRKGAALSNGGLVMIPGSRGDYSYLVKPKGDHIKNSWSLAHGAGRKFKRSEMKSRVKEKVESLRKTKLGSLVICENKNLMYEEAPEAYKNIERVIEDLLAFDLIDLVAKFKPMVTYKTRRSK